VGYRGDPGSPSAVLLRHNRRHLELQIDRGHAIGRTDPAGVADVLMEAAITSIMDCEDSVAAVDADDKVLGYRNWLGLNRGDLTEQVSKGDETFTRVLSEDRNNYDAEPIVPATDCIALPRRVQRLAISFASLASAPDLMKPNFLASPLSRA